MPRLRLGSENVSLQNETGRSIFISKFVFVLVTKSTQKNPKHSEFFKIICFETSSHMTHRPRFDATCTTLCIARMEIFNYVLLLSFNCTFYSCFGAIFHFSPKYTCCWDVLLGQQLGIIVWRQRKLNHDGDILTYCLVQVYVVWKPYEEKRT